MGRSRKIQQALDHKTKPLGITARGKQDKSKKQKKAKRACAASSPPPLPPPPSSYVADAIAYTQLNVDENDVDPISTCQEALTIEVENLSAGQEGNNMVYANPEGRGLMERLLEMVCVFSLYRTLLRATEFTLRVGYRYYSSESPV